MAYHWTKYKIVSQITKDIFLNPIGEGKTRLLVFFDFDKSVLKDESKPELERMIRFLSNNEELKIELHGHTDDRGTDDYNDKLSMERASSVKDYLTNGGVETDRIIVRGYGKRKPLIDASTDEARARNRRVEMVVVKD